MPGQNKTRLLGWHPASAEDSAWVRAEAERRGGRGKGALARLLDEALADLRAKHEQASPDAADRELLASIKDFGDRLDAGIGQAAGIPMTALYRQLHEQDLPGDPAFDVEAGLRDLKERLRAGTDGTTTEEGQ